MKRVLRFKKSIAVFLLVLVINQFAVPTVAYALTSGPTAPEATSFEPIDTTDMVNPLNGNFTYNIPLLEVPGPEGGYPLSLSYHADVQPNMEASWVGFGWTLNPGAITRSVSGYADDFSNVSQGRRDYWEGGSRSTFGISVGLPGMVTFGLSFSQDTYQGFGVGASIGLDKSFGPIGLGLTYGTDGYGGQYAGISAGISTLKKGELGLGLGGSIGLSTNFSSVSASAGTGVSYRSGDGRNQSLLGVSISSDQLKPGLSVGGGSASVYNVNKGKIQTESTGFSFAIPLPGGFSVGLSNSYTRYWSDESVTVGTYGSLYTPQTISTQSSLASAAYDNYKLDDLEEGSDAMQGLEGGTFPDFDSYSVTAQGISGSMRPFIFQSLLYNQNKHETDVVSGDEYDVQDDTSIGATSMTMFSANQFRFINDFSNRFTQSSPNLTSASSIKFAAPVYGNDDADYGVNFSTGHLSGSKRITYFTNAEIVSQYAKSRGFMDTRSAGFIRMGKAGDLNNEKGDQQIGGFMITNTSGVTYHYALPAYEYNEFSRTDTNDDPAFTASTRNEPYAYTWFLTAITGPDFVDKNANGFADAGDWGYWLNFDYGKWADNVKWRNPAQGNHVEVDSRYGSYSQGMKEMYYLDAISSRTHTAIFEKEMRADGKSVTFEEDGKANPSFKPNLNSCTLSDNTPYYDYPKATLRLNNIYLFQNDQLPATEASLRTTGTQYTVALTGANGQFCTPPVPVHYGDNVIDKSDVSSTWTSKCLRKIAFNYDYSLSPNTPNSYDKAGTSTYTASPNTNPTSFSGKLTLLSVDFQGKAGALVTPPIQFEYDLDPYDAANQEVIDINGLNNSAYTHSTSKFRAGDIISFVHGGTTYYATLLATQDNRNFPIRFLNASPGTALSNISAVRTKNPPYVQEAYDIWGNFKSDYVAVYHNENLSRLPTKISNRQADVWCLRKIKTSLGAEFTVHYEGDTYNRSVLNKTRAMLLSSGSYDTDGQYLLFTLSNPQGYDLNDLYPVGSSMEGLVLIDRHLSSGGSSYTGQSFFDLSLYNAKVYSINGNTIKMLISAPLLSDLRDPDLGNGLPDNTAVENYTINSLTVLAGNFLTTGANLNYGGGIRVRDITADDLNGEVKKTAYNYEMPKTSTDEPISSGVTSYEPATIDADALDAISGVVDGVKKDYRTKLRSGMDILLPIAREAPAPGVMYEYVSMADSAVLANGNRVALGGTERYQFRVFNKGMLGLHANTGTVTGFTNVSQRNLSIKDYTSQIGNLIRVVRYDTKGQKLSETVNRYLNEDIVNNAVENQVAHYDGRLASYSYQGMIQERYGEAVKTTAYASKPTRWVITTATRDQIPVIQTGSTFYDYKNGTRIDQTILAYDFYSGQVTSSLNVDSYGNRFKNEITPAYRKYPSMGLKTASTDNLNMLSQEAGNYTYVVDSDDNPTDVLTASVQTWGNDIAVLDPDGATATTGQSKIWRMKAGYQWMKSGTSADNLTPYASFVDYFATTGSKVSWIKTNEVLKYNVYSNALEAADINGNYAGTLMGYNSSKVLISGGPARYNELAFSGAEDEVLNNGKFSGAIDMGDGTVTTGNIHTGVKSLSVPASGKGFNRVLAISALRAQNYSVSVWVKASLAPTGAVLYYNTSSLSTVTPTQSYTKSAGGWYLLEMRVPASAFSGTGSMAIGCANNSAGTQYFDDFRIQPTAASALAYVYDSKTGDLTHVLDNNNLYTRYQYDAAGRLIKTYREVLGKTTVPVIRAVIYNYATDKFYNPAISKVFYKNCSGANVPYTYTVAAGTYMSAISRQDAIAQAQSDLDTNGQAQADANVACGAILTLQNSVLGGESGFAARLTNTTTGVATFYNFSSTGTVSYNISAATYTVFIGPVQTSEIHTFGCTGQTNVTGAGATFSGISFTAGTINTLTIQ